MSSSRRLDSSKIVDTLKELQRRISERFPDSGLARVSLDLVAVATENEATVRNIHRGGDGFRLGITVVLVIVFAGIAAWIIPFADGLRWAPQHGVDLITMVEAMIATVVFIGAAIIYIMSLDTKSKRQRARRKLFELRAIAHVVDMHQLHKDPDRIRRVGQSTASTPEFDMTPFELGRYLDYCSEMLSLISKIGALYVQGYDDADAISGVVELENLTAGLARKVWQKIMILDGMMDRDHV
ncbi:MAG: hypothetical protein CMJ83_08940 [Planctomycetes bacterium]|nr:hypothetical protein [Planctomycetota bacterium]